MPIEFSEKEFDSSIEKLKILNQGFTEMYKKIYKNKNDLMNELSYSQNFLDIISEICDLQFVLLRASFIGHLALKSIFSNFLRYNKEDFLEKFNELIKSKTVTCTYIITLPHFIFRNVIEIDKYKICELGPPLEVVVLITQSQLSFNVFTACGYLFPHFFST